MTTEPEIAVGLGIVRAARRPPGWIPPGPPPATTAPRADLAPRPGEDLCYLAGDWRIFQKIRGHRWSLDDLVTAALAAESCGERRPRRILDLGSGIGAVALLLAWRFPQARVVSIEAQAESRALARRSITWNGCGDRCDARLGDLRDFALGGELPFDLVTGTPPYLPLGTATPPRRAEQPGCHLELRGDVGDYARAAARALAAGGRLVLCHSSRERVERAAESAALHLRSVRDVVPRAGKRALFAVFALERAPGPTVVEPPLVVRDATGARTPPFSALRAGMGMPP